MTRFILGYWRWAWLRFCGQSGFGRLASYLASIGTRPYHGRAFLAHLRKDGFIAGSARISHPELRLGRNVYLGDGVNITLGNGGREVFLGDEVQIYGDSFLHTQEGGSLTIGQGTHIQPGCHLYACVADIVIGRKVEIAARCAFYPYNHGMKQGSLIMEQPLSSKGNIVVGDGAWLGHGVVVLEGVRIGEGAVIGAGAVVVRDVPENSIAAGVPARIVGERMA